MKPIRVLSGRSYQNRPSSILVAVVMAGVGFGIAAERALGARPSKVARPPFFSFDLTSPSVAGAPFFLAGDILWRNPTPPPAVSVPAASLGLGAGDELDALSANNDHLDPAARFTLLFSVDRNTVGILPSHPGLGVKNPFNVMDQATLRVQEAGDQYMTINRFTRAGGIQPPPDQSRAIDTNTLIRNQYNEGGSDFGGLPYIPASALNLPARLSAPRDLVDATMLSGRSSRTVAEVYFSVSNLSPSPMGLFNGAAIFYDSGPAGAGPTTVYAWPFQLALVDDDDIDALIVFDTDSIGFFDADDMVLIPDADALDLGAAFSLAFWVRPG